MEICQIKETSLYIRDLEISRKFYEEKLGLEVIAKVENRHIFFRAGRSVLLCFISEVTKYDQSMPSHFANGNIHLAFEVKAEDYYLWKENVKEKDIKIVQEQLWKKDLESFYFRDPDGHLLEVIPKGIWD
jgi:catechol 2,3-dioxygenase-like lactoylglutathione lyase family enzyme